MGCDKLNTLRCRRRLKRLALVIFGPFVLFLVYMYFGDHSSSSIPQSLSHTRINSTLTQPTSSFSSFLNSTNLTMVNPINSLTSIILPEVTVVVVACGQGDVVEDSLTLIKWAIMLSRGVDLRVILFTDNMTDEERKITFDTEVIMGYSTQAILGKETLKTLTQISDRLGYKFRYEIRNSSFPTDGEMDWRNLYMPCTTQRLFLPELLHDIDAVIYLDADTIPLRSLKEIWDQFGHMTSSQVMAMANEHELPGDGWYNKIAKTPYYEPRGLNGGVALMNLTRLRTVESSKEMIRMYHQHEKYIMLADQDILNIYFEKYPDLMYNISCAFNFRNGHCICDYPDYTHRSCRCHDAEVNGIAIVHGNRDGFDNGTLAVIHRLFKKFDLESGNPLKMLEQIELEWSLLQQSELGTCIKDKLLINFRNYFSPPRTNLPAVTVAVQVDEQII